MNALVYFDCDTRKFLVLEFVADFRLSAWDLWLLRDCRDLAFRILLIAWVWVWLGFSVFGIVVGPSGVGWVYGLVYFGGIALELHLLVGCCDFGTAGAELWVFGFYWWLWVSLVCVNLWFVGFRLFQFDVFCV